ncbi:MAG: ribosome maturation factor RimP [Oscillospiraceae bacterium]|nr:ribosome maturation factor RimP [Oscillospiraceae bacterium]
MSKLTDLVTQLAAPIAEKNGCEIWDVEYVKEAGIWYLRVYIDCEGGVNIDQCEAISRELDPILDEKDYIEGNYTFEVSSAGAERVLKRPSDFARFIGSTVEVKLYKSRNGSKEFVGLLQGYENGTTAVEVAGRTELFTKEETAQVRLRITF